MNPPDPFAAIADPNRRKLLEMLRDGPRSVNDLAKGLTVSRPAVSQHLKVLLDSGLATVESRGTQRLYAIGDNGMMRLNLWLDQFWADESPAE